MLRYSFRFSYHFQWYACYFIDTLRVGETRGSPLLFQKYINLLCKENANDAEIWFRFPVNQSYGMFCALCVSVCTCVSACELSFFVATIWSQRMCWYFAWIQIVCVCVCVCGHFHASYLFYWTMFIQLNIIIIQWRRCEASWYGTGKFTEGYKLISKTRSKYWVHFKCHISHLNIVLHHL